MQQVEWAEFELQELFESSSGDFDIQKTHINDLGDYVITAGLSNNGILGKTNVEAKIFEADTITIDMFGNAFYRQFCYKMVTHARVFSLKTNFQITQKQGIFFASALHFLKYKFGYENMCSWAKVKSEKISLPIKPNANLDKLAQIDFDFMENFIAQLEAYLLVTGLKDYTLTPAEQQALADFENGEVVWEKFRMGDLFEVKTSEKRFDANKVEIKSIGYPYVVRTATNNGIKGYLNEDEIYLNEGNTISFGQDTATMFYQAKPYFTGDKIKILKPKLDLFNNKNAQFFIPIMTRAFSSFSWGRSSFREEIIKSQKLSLPIKPDANVDKLDQINFDFMDLLLKAIQKLVIKDVVHYADKKIKATQQVING